MLIWFAETTIVAGILALVALAIGRLRPISSVGQARALARRADQVRDASPGVLAMGVRLAQPRVACRVAKHGSPAVARRAGPSDDRPGPAPANRSFAAGRSAATSSPHRQESDDSRAGDPACRRSSLRPITGAADDDAAAETIARSTDCRRRRIRSLFVAAVAAAVPRRHERNADWRGCPSRSRIAIGQAIRIIRFRRRLRGAVPRPTS